jgi:hypothetical protein
MARLGSDRELNTAIIAIKHNDVKPACCCLDHITTNTINTISIITTIIR